MRPLIQSLREIGLMYKCEEYTEYNEDTLKQSSPSLSLRDNKIFFMLNGMQAKEWMAAFKKTKTRK